MLNSVTVCKIVQMYVALMCLGVVGLTCLGVLVECYVLMGYSWVDMEAGLWHHTKGLTVVCNTSGITIFSLSTFERCFLHKHSTRYAYS